MVKKKQVIQSGAWQMLNVIVKVISQFGYYAVMARLLQKSELGVFALLNSFMNFGNMIGDGGMGDALLQRRETDKQHVNAAFYSSMLLAAIIYAVIFFVAPWAAEFYKEPQLTSSLRIFSIIFWFAAMYSPSLRNAAEKFQIQKNFCCRWCNAFTLECAGYCVSLLWLRYNVAGLVADILFWCRIITAFVLLSYTTQTGLYKKTLERPYWLRFRLNTYTH